MCDWLPIFVPCHVFPPGAIFTNNSKLNIGGTSCFADTSEGVLFQSGSYFSPYWTGYGGENDGNVATTTTFVLACFVTFLVDILVGPNRNMWKRLLSWRVDKKRVNRAYHDMGQWRGGEGHRCFTFRRLLLWSISFNRVMTSRATNFEWEPALVHFRVSFDAFGSWPSCRCLSCRNYSHGFDLAISAFLQPPYTWKSRNYASVATSFSRTTRREGKEVRANAS